MASIKLNIDIALSSILNNELLPIDLPDNVAGISRVLGKDGDIYNNLLRTATRLKGGRPLDDGQLEKVGLWLQALHSLELLHPRYKYNSKIDKALKDVIMNPKFKFPYPYPDIAEAVLGELEEANWGEQVVETEMDDLPDSEHPPVVDSPTTIPSAIPSSRDADQTSEQIQAAENDPIFGSKGIMHDIDIYLGKIKRYGISLDFHKPSSKVFGHNNIAVGTVFPLQIAAFRDGAHGSYMGGIAGTAADGCYSIVISGKYDEVDHDMGDTIYYSDSKALSNKAEYPEQTTGTDALRRSIMTGRPVRVLRSSGGKWVGCPRVGLRYDGLYRVVSESIKTNKLGGGYVQFQLRRLTTQPEINRYAPDAVLTQKIRRVKDGITRRG